MSGHAKSKKYITRFRVIASSKHAQSSIQVAGDVPALPSLRPNPAPTQTLGLREGRVGTSPETWIDPSKGGEGRHIPVRHK